MSSLSSVVLIEPQRTLAFGSITGSYLPIGTAYAHPVRMYMLQNFTDGALQFSWDGVVDHFPLPAGGALIFDIGSNKSTEGNTFEAFGNRFTYVKTLGTAPTSGSVYLSIFYGK